MLDYGLPTPSVPVRMPMTVRRLSRKGAKGFPPIRRRTDNRIKNCPHDPVTSMDNTDDKRIIEAVLAGRVVQFGSLVERYQKPIYSFMLRLTGSPSDAEDLTQEVFVRAFEKLRQFKQDRRFFPWLYTIAVNRGRDHLRKKGLRRKLFAEEPENSPYKNPAADEGGGKLECVLIMGEIVDAMAKMPSSYREPLLLYYREEFTIKEIAAALKISPTAVKARLHRGRKMLKRLIGEHHAIE